MNVKVMLATAVFGSVASCEPSMANDKLNMLVGTYTEQSMSEGIYTYVFDQSSGKATLCDSVKADNPSFLVVSDDDTHVYSVSEYDDGRQGVLAFGYDKATGSLKPLGRQTCGLGAKRHDNTMPGAAPCNIMILGRNVVTSNYNGGDISVFPLSADGTLLPENQYFDMHVDGSNAVSHIHCCRVTPDGRYMLAADLGNDCLWRFDIDSRDGSLAHPVMAYRAPSGTGPRHFVFNAKGDRVYMLGELDGSLTVLSYKSGLMTEIQRVQASETPTAGSADIHLSPDGKFLYASHRLKDEGVSIFSVAGETGQLKKIGFQPTAAHPRNFAITPNGRYVLVACRDSNAIEIYRRDTTTGLLVKTDEAIHVGKPVCVVLRS